MARVVYKEWLSNKTKIVGISHQESSICKEQLARSPKNNWVTAFQRFNWDTFQIDMRSSWLWPTTVQLNNAGNQRVNFEAMSHSDIRHCIIDSQRQARVGLHFFGFCFTLLLHFNFGQAIFARVYLAISLRQNEKARLTEFRKTSQRYESAFAISWSIVLQTGTLRRYTCN